MRNLIRTIVVLATACGLALGAGACGGDPPKRAATPTTAASLLPLPKPTGEAVLDIARGGAETVAVDFATLDGLADKTYSVVEPFEKKMIDFSGVELWSVLAASGVPTTAKTVLLTALDDYKVELSVADLRAGGVILATRADSELIPLDHGGPMRVIFLENVEAGRNPDQWIWSLAHVVVT
jgi:hypothetical protein